MTNTHSEERFICLCCGIEDLLFAVHTQKPICGKLGISEDFFFALSRREDLFYFCFMLSLFKSLINIITSVTHVFSFFGLRLYI